MLLRHATTLSLLLASASAAHIYDDEVPSSTAPAPACTASSSSGSGAFFDLRPDTAVASEDGKSHRGVMAKDYRARGWDYGKNFTMNICGAVVDPILDVVGVNQDLWANVSAYYESHGKIYSIGFVRPADAVFLVAALAMFVLTFRADPNPRTCSVEGGSWSYNTREGRRAARM